MGVRFGDSSLGEGEGLRCGRLGVGSAQGRELVVAGRRHRVQHHLVQTPRISAHTHTHTHSLTHTHTHTADGARHMGSTVEVGVWLKGERE